MKRLFILLALMPGLCFSAPSIKFKPVTDIAAGAVSVSTTTATALYSGTSELAGRTIILLVNTDPDYDVFIGESDVTAATGFAVTNSSDSATARISLPIGSNNTLYAIGESNAVKGTIDVRVLELKQ